MGDLFNLLWYFADLTRTGEWDKTNEFLMQLPPGIRYHVEVVGEWIAQAMGWS